MNYGFTPTARRSLAAQKTARRLGWLSIGLGLAEVVAPRFAARATGLQGRETLLRGYGVREIATGVGLLAARNPTPWLWARVAGDVLDLATLGTRVERGNPRRQATLASLAAVVGATAFDVACARAAARSEQRRRELTSDYRRRSGLPKPASEMRGAAKDFRMPADLRAPQGMQPLVGSEARTGERGESGPGRTP